MEKRYFFYSFKEWKIQNKNWKNIIEYKIIGEPNYQIQRGRQILIEKIISFIFILVYILLIFA